MYRLLFVMLVAVTTFTSCGGWSNGNSSKEARKTTDYFFPTDSLKPYIYVYADINRPVDEKFYRVYTLQTANKHHLVVERFNANFRITEGYTYDIDDEFKVVDHMVTDAQGKKRQASLTEVSMFPTSFESEARFVSDFPAHIDSLMGVYKSTKVVVDSMDYELLGKNTRAIVVNDEVTLSFVHPKTRKGSSNSVEIQRVYAKGFGLTEWYTADKKVHYKLKRVLSDKWWKEHAQGPVIRGVAN